MQLKIALGSVGLILFLLPLFASAAVFCPNLTQDMWFASCNENIDDPDCARHVTGDQVSQLQHFLMDYFNNPVGLWMSGYFGNKTKLNTIAFQDAYDVPTTGYAGPLTRAAIARACTTTTTPPQCPVVTPPSCPNGTLVSNGTDDDGCSLGYSCSNSTGASCSLDGATVAHGQTRTFYSARTAETLYCLAYNVERTCTNGVLSGDTTYHFAACGPSVSTTSCTFNGQTVANGSSVTAYRPAQTNREECVSQTRTCTNGTLSGSYLSASCTPNVTTPPVDPANGVRLIATPASGAAPLSVLFTSNVNATMTFGDGTSGVLAPNCLAGTNTGVETQQCNLGTNPNPYFVFHTYSSSGTYIATLTTHSGGDMVDATRTITVTGTSNSDIGTSCEFTSGRVVAHGASITAYQSSTRTAWQECVSQTRTCSNGVLSGSYQYATCSLNGTSNSDTSSLNNSSQVATAVATYEQLVGVLQQLLTFLKQ